MNEGRRFALLKHIHDVVTSLTSLNGKDGISAPAAVASTFQIYVDKADGSLKVKFGNGTVKTLATNP